MKEISFALLFIISLFYSIDNVQCDIEVLLPSLTLQGTSSSSSPATTTTSTIYSVSSSEFNTYKGPYVGYINKFDFKSLKSCKMSDIENLPNIYPNISVVSLQDAKKYCTSMTVVAEILALLKPSAIIFEGFDDTEASLISFYCEELYCSITKKEGATKLANLLLNGDVYVNLTHRDNPWDSFYTSTRYVGFYYFLICAYILYLFYLVFLLTYFVKNKFITLNIRTSILSIQFLVWFTKMGLCLAEMDALDFSDFEISAFFYYTSYIACLISSLPLIFAWIKTFQSSLTFQNGHIWSYFKIFIMITAAAFLISLTGVLIIILKDNNYVVTSTPVLALRGLYYSFATLYGFFFLYCSFKMYMILSVLESKSKSKEVRTKVLITCVFVVVSTFLLIILEATYDSYVYRDYFIVITVDSIFEIIQFVMNSSVIYCISAGVNRFWQSQGSSQPQNSTPGKEEMKNSASIRTIHKTELESVMEIRDEKEEQAKDKNINQFLENRY